MIYTVVLNPALDVLYELGELVPGTTVTDVPSQMNPAGKGLNVARVVRALGEEVGVVAVMPDDSRAMFGRHCHDRKIKPLFYGVTGAARVNVTLYEKSAGQVTHINSEGVRLSPRIQDEFISYAGEIFAPDDIWAFCGSLPAGVDRDVYRILIEQAHANRIVSLLDTRGEALRLGGRAKPVMIKPNLSELEQFFGEQVKGVRHIALKAKRLIDMGIPYVFISLGSDGMIALHENDCLLCSVPQVRVIDTVGCGDALVAGLVVGRARHFSFSEMCRMGVACGVSNAMHAGPGAVELDEVWRLMEEVTVENV